MHTPEISDLTKNESENFVSRFGFQNLFFAIIPCWAGVSRTLASFKMEFSVKLWKLHFRCYG